MIMAATSGIDLTSASDFLKYGPLGLAGLMLVLVIVALMSIRNLRKNQTQLLTLLLYVGTFCFIAASGFAVYASLTDGSKIVDDYKARDMRQAQVLRQILRDAKDSIPILEEVASGIGSGGACSGGSSGQPLPHGNEWAGKTRNVAGKLGSASDAITALGL